MACKNKMETVQRLRDKHKDDKPANSRYISDYYLMEHTGAKRYVPNSLRKVLRFEEERVMAGHYWHAQYKWFNGIWGRMYYLYGNTLPKEVDAMYKRYDNVAVYEYNESSHPVYKKGKSVFIADVCFDIKKREKPEPVKKRKTPVDPSKLYVNDPAKQAKNARR